MKANTLALLIFTTIVMGSVACIGGPHSAIQITPLSNEERAEKLSDKAYSLLDSGDYQQAIQMYTQAIDLSPDYYRYLARGSAYSKLGNYTQACKDFRSSGNALMKNDKISDHNLAILKENIRACS